MGEHQPLHLFTLYRWYWLDEVEVDVVEIAHTHPHPAHQSVTEARRTDRRQGDTLPALHRLQQPVQNLRVGAKPGWLCRCTEVLDDRSIEARWIACHIGATASPPQVMDGNHRLRAIPKCGDQLLVPRG